jgi:hypothetical protein
MKRKGRKKTPLMAEERQWRKQFAALVKYQQKNGHCLVPQACPGNLRLGQWVAEQRALWRSGKLSSDRFERLQRIGFAWDFQHGRWEKQFQALQAFRLQHGHCQVPGRTKRNPSLGDWVHFQRVQKWSGRLSAERIRRLEQIGFDWISRGHSAEFRDSAYWDTNWDNMLAELKQFKRRFGHTWVPSSPPNHPTLSRWVSRQRRLKQQGQLSRDRRRKLEAAGFDWRSPSVAKQRWERCFARLLEFRRRFGHCHVPAEWKENITIGRWVVKTRMQRKMGLLSAEQVRRLNEVGFVWDPISKRSSEHDAIWARSLAQLVAFRKKHGHWCVPTDQPKFHSLRVWMDNQRINYSRGWLSADRIKRLEKVRFPWLSDRGRSLLAK